MRIEVDHRWVVTGGNSPDDPPHYCPLHADYAASLHAWETMRHHRATDPDSLATMMAAMAFQIPESSARMWYRIEVAAHSTWTPTSASTSIGDLKAQAIAELINSPTPTITITGSHPGTEPTSTRLEDLTIQSAWTVTGSRTDPARADHDLIHGADPRIGPHFAGHAGLTRRQALDAYHAHRDDLIAAGMDDMAGPSDGFTLWYRLQITAHTPWLTDVDHVILTDLIDELINSAAAP